MKWLILLLLSISVQGGPPENKSCIACVMIRNNHGQHTGHQCHRDDEIAVSGNSETFENKYPQCVPDQYEITRKINEYCCFWSPELGCSILFDRESFDGPSKACSRCRAYCIAPDDHDDDNGRYTNSGHMIAKDWSLFFLFFTLTIFGTTAMFNWIVMQQVVLLILG
uniref:Uncharacterized protein LOC108052961 n=1 Tax=Drosophila rhopaloa TaxID=1041015 RepID=A0A6P4FTT1_DRORH